MSFTCPTCGTVKGCLSGYSLQMSPQHTNTIEALAASEQRVEAAVAARDHWIELARVRLERAEEAEQRNRELTRQVDQLQATLERIGAMSVRFACACGRPTGTGAIKSCADKALATLTASPSSSDPGRADTEK